MADQLSTIAYSRPEATYLAWLDCGALDLDAPAPLDQPGIVTDLAGPAKLVFDSARVALSSGNVYATGGAHHVRLSFATHPDILTEAITRMRYAIENTTTTRRPGPAADLQRLEPQRP